MGFDQVFRGRVAGCSNPSELFGDLATKGIGVADKEDPLLSRWGDVPRDDHPKNGYDDTCKPNHALRPFAIEAHHTGGQWQNLGGGRLRPAAGRCFAG
jgi:hypothetical protein